MYIYAYACDEEKGVRCCGISTKAMGKFLAKRLSLCLLILVFATFAVYLLMYFLPSGYIENMARQAAQRPGNAESYEVILERMNAQYGMDQGPLMGYITWGKNAIVGNFGDSWVHTEPVVTVFRDVVWYSFVMGLIAFVIQTIIAIPLGVRAAVKQYSMTDYTVTVFTLIGISMPTFFVATLLKLVFALKLGWFDVSGSAGRNFHLLDGWGRLLDQAHHLVLPIATLIIIGIGSLMRYTRTNMLEVLNSDYIRTARAKGLPEKKVISYHAFRNTLIPLVTVLGGSLPGLFSGALITETLFSLDGIGKISYESMVGGDIPFTMFYLAFMSILTLLGTLISDILYAVVDPRVRVN